MGKTTARFDPPERLPEDQRVAWIELLPQYPWVTETHLSTFEDIVRSEVEMRAASARVSELVAMEPDSRELPLASKILDSARAARVICEKRLEKVRETWEIENL